VKEYSKPRAKAPVKHVAFEIFLFLVLSKQA